MAIFCRRTLQRLINENATFLTRKQLVSHVNKLNDGDLSAEWEVVLLNVFSKVAFIGIKLASSRLLVNLSVSILCRSRRAVIRWDRFRDLSSGISLGCLTNEPVY
jgi:hypothetical protein